MWAYPKHPCTQSFRSHGLAVGHIERYPLQTPQHQYYPPGFNHRPFPIDDKSYFFR
jgi:hypothetical protein